MEFVQKYIQDRLDSEGLSFSVQLVENACVYSMHSGQEMVILQSDVGLCARATLCKCFAEKLIMTHHPEHGPLLQIKDTFVTVDWTQSLADQHVSISADLLDEKNGDSEEFIGVLVLQVLLDTMLQQGKTPPSSHTPCCLPFLVQIEYMTVKDQIIIRFCFEFRRLGRYGRCGHSADGDSGTEQGRGNRSRVNDIPPLWKLAIVLH